MGLGVCLYSLGDLLLYWPEPAQLALEAASTDPRVTEVLGTPIKRGWFWGGDNRKVDAGQSESEDPITMLIPISGPNGKVRLLRGAVHAGALYADDSDVCTADW